MRMFAELAAVEVTMTRRDKLLYFAKLVREAGRNPQMYNGIEYFAPAQLRSLDISGTAFEVAIKDAVFQAAGLKSTATLGDVMDFFQLSQTQLHEFSCDCGGRLSNQAMAQRIEHLA